MAKLLLIMLGVFLILASSLGAATYTVNSDQSIQAAIDQAAAGDTIVLNDGVYYETLTIDKAITLAAANPGRAVITNQYPGKITWKQSDGDPQNWYADGIDWPVHWLLVEGLHAFDYRTKENFDTRTCGPYWSKGFQKDLVVYDVSPIYFARDAELEQLWLHLNDGRDPNNLDIDINSSKLDGVTLVQKDLGTGWNQQEIVTISSDPPVHPIIMWYKGTKDNPSEPRIINFPRICGVIINIKADHVTLDGLRIHMAPTVGVEVNNSHHVTISDCYFSGYQFAINTGYECTNLTVTHCEMDGGLLKSFGNHTTNFYTMWYHSTYVNPVKFNGTGLSFTHNYVYEGFDLFHPRGRHKDFAHVADLRSEVAYNVWQNATDNAIEFDGVEARMNMRFHHNLVIQDYDALAITTTENGGPLTIDHNIWWPGDRGRIMKLVGTGRTNRGVHFVHNTYFSGSQPSWNKFEESIFENNIILSTCTKPDSWSVEKLASFFPTKYNLLKDGDVYTSGFAGLTSDPMLGDTPDIIFVIQPGSPAINAGRTDSAYYQDNVADNQPDLGALEFGQTIDDWRKDFGHCGPTWINRDNQPSAAPCRPRWPEQLDARWGGFDQ